MLHVPVRATDFTLLESVKSRPGTHQAHFSIGNGVYFPGGLKRPVVNCPQNFNFVRSIHLHYNKHVSEHVTSKHS